MSGAERNSETRTSLGEEASLLAHELHNILTVLFGVVEELQRDASEIALRNAPLLKAGVDKTEQVAGALFSLRRRLLEGMTVEPRSIAAAIAPALDVPRLVDAFDGTQRLQGEAALVERLVLAVAVVGARCSGLKDVTPLHIPDDGRPGRDGRVVLQFGAALGDDDAAMIERAIGDLGGTTRCSNASVTCELLVAKNGNEETPSPPE